MDLNLKADVRIIQAPDVNDDEILQRMWRIEKLLMHLQKSELREWKELSALAAEVRGITNAEQSALILLGGIAAAIKKAGTDPVKLRELVAQLASSSDELSKAVVENTPEPGKV